MRSTVHLAGRICRSADRRPPDKLRRCAIHALFSASSHNGLFLEGAFPWLATQSTK